MNLRARFAADLVSGLIGEAEVAPLYTEFEAAYTEGRHYHDLRHITNCLDSFDFIVHEPVEVRAVKAAIYYHDFVYDSKAKDSEERSADIAVDRLKRLGYSSGFCQRVHGIIMATKHKGDATLIDHQVMCDVDLAELAADSATFARNTDNIRQEFSWVSDDDWRKGRAAFYRDMLGRKMIYYTGPFQTLFETKARENLNKGLIMLEAA